MPIGRNDSCPCGSGRKYKRCCLPKQEVISLEGFRRGRNHMNLMERLMNLAAQSRPKRASSTV